MSNLDLELEVMARVKKELDRLEGIESVARVISWVASGYGALLGNSRRTKGASNTADFGDAISGERFTSAADLFDATNPVTEPEKVLVIAYWLQEVEGQGDVESQSINSELKNLGHGIGNITRALSNLIQRRPRLVIQTRKSGTTQQARKKYKVTVEGIRFVEGMLSGFNE